jgi:hypothetical protein
MEWKDLSSSIKELMLFYQEQQSGARNEDVFINNITAGKNTGGFNWCDTPQGHGVWSALLNSGK